MPRRFVGAENDEYGRTFGEFLDWALTQQQAAQKHLWLRGTLLPGTASHSTPCFQHIAQPMPLPSNNIGSRWPTDIGSWWHWLTVAYRHWLIVALAHGGIGSWWPTVADRLRCHVMS